MIALDTFKDRPSLGLRYENELRVLLLNRLRTACWLAIVLVPLFAALDMILYPHLLVPFSLIRLVIVALAAAVLLSLRTAAGRRHVRALSFFVFYQTGFGIVLMACMNGGGSSPYYAGVNLVMLAAAVVMPFDVRLSAAFSATLIGTYVWVCLTFAGVPDPRAFTGNLFFLVSTGIITIVSHAVGTVARRRELLQRVALEQAGRHRDEFLANITHELRTPLSAILGFCEMLEDYMMDATCEQRTWLARIHENALTLYRLIVQLLDFSKLEAGAMRIARERCRLDPIVTRVAADMRAIAGPGGIEIGVELAPETPSVIGDPARIEEVVTNLAMNALKFSGGRPIKLGLRHGGIDAGGQWHRVVPDPGLQAGSTTYVEVSVTDHGEGIRADDLRRLFVAFQQLDGSPTRRQGGTGLGLAISARLAAAMHGYIAVSSTLGTGSTFALLLPAEQSAATQAVVDKNQAGRTAASLTAA